MKPYLATAAALAALALAPTAHAATSTRPTLVTVAYNSRKVVATVTVDNPATVTLGNDAYRHPYQEQARVVTSTAGTVTIEAACSPIVLPHTWRVLVDGVLVASTSGIRCR